MTGEIEWEPDHVSSYSDGANNCVAAGRGVGPDGEVVAGVRDTKDLKRHRLVFAPETWRRFLAAVKDGDADA